MSRYGTVIERDGTLLTTVIAGGSFRFGRSPDVVDYVLSTSAYLSAHAGTIVGTAQTCWIQNWSSHTPFLLRDTATLRSTVEVPPGTQRLNPFAEARLEVYGAPGVQDALVLRSTVLDQLEVLPGRAPTRTKSRGDELRRAIKADHGRAQPNVRQWYSCLALCEPMLRDPVDGVAASHFDIGRRLAPLVDLESGRPVEPAGRRASEKTIGKRLRAVREKVDPDRLADGSAGADSDASQRLAELLIRSGAITLRDVELYLDGVDLPDDANAGDEDDDAPDHRDDDPTAEATP